MLFLIVSCKNHENPQLALASSFPQWCKTAGSSLQGILVNASALENATSELHAWTLYWQGRRATRWGFAHEINENQSWAARLHSGRGMNLLLRWVIEEGASSLLYSSDSRILSSWSSITPMLTPLKIWGQYVMKRFLPGVAVHNQK